MGRRPCCSKEGLNKGAWTNSEDQILVDYINVHGQGKWRDLPQKAGLRRCGKSCRLRWLNYLRPDIKRGNISHDEEDLIIRLHKLLGNRWSLIAGRLPGRTDNEIKNYWNTCLRKKAKGQSIQMTDFNNTKEIMKNKNRTIQNSVESRVTPLFHTKAVKCTRIFVSPQEQNLIEYNNSKIRLEQQRSENPLEASEEDTLNSWSFEIEKFLSDEFPDTDFFKSHGEKMIMNNDFMDLSSLTDQEDIHPALDLQSLEKWLQG